MLRAYAFVIFVISNCEEVSFLILTCNIMVSLGLAVFSLAISLHE